MISTAEAAPLDNNTDNVSQQGCDQRERRWDLRDDLREITGSKRFLKCGRTRIAPEVTMRLTEGVAGYVGIAICGLPWLCPVCSSKIAMRRSLELAAGFDWWMNGPTPRPVLFPTATAQHHAGQALQPTLDAVVKAWRSAQSGRFWVEDRDRLFIAGVVRTLEVLRSQRNGWHPHIHGVMPCGEGVTDRDAAIVGARFFRRWNASLERSGYTSLAIAQRFELIHPGSAEAPNAIGRYLAKLPDYTIGQSLGYELTGGENKAGRSSGRTPWQLAVSAVGGNARDAALWREYEAATFNRRQTTWSPGLRSLLALGQEESDLEIASEAMGTDDDAVVSISADGWSTVHQLRLGPTLLRVLEQSYTQLISALTQLGIEHTQIRSHAS